MKNVLVSFAEYNLAVGNKVLEILQPLPDAILLKDVGVYYRSILGILEHILISEIIFIKRFSSFFPYSSLQENEIVLTDMEKIKGDVKNNRRKIFELLPKIDALLVQFTHQLDEADLSKKVRYTTSAGAAMEKTYWKTIFLAFNHGTHHRGEISAILDIQKIANDFAGFTLYSD